MSSSRPQPTPAPKGDPPGDDAPLVPAAAAASSSKKGKQKKPVASQDEADKKLVAEKIAQQIAQLELGQAGEKDQEAELGEFSRPDVFPTSHRPSPASSSVSGTRNGSKACLVLRRPIWVYSNPLKGGRRGGVHLHHGSPGVPRSFPC